jgi:hypothetical protein
MRLPRELSGSDLAQAPASSAIPSPAKPAVTFVSPRTSMANITSQSRNIPHSALELCPPSLLMSRHTSLALATKSLNDSSVISQGPVAARGDLSFSWRSRRRLPSLQLAQAQSIPPSSPSAGLGFSANISEGAEPPVLSSILFQMRRRRLLHLRLARRRGHHTC